MPSVRHTLLVALGGLSCAAGQAQQADGPDAEFLEYLGAWDEDYEDWLALTGGDGNAPPPADGRPEADTDTDDGDE